MGSPLKDEPQEEQCQRCYRTLEGADRGRDLCYNCEAEIEEDRRAAHEEVEERFDRMRE